MDERDRLISSSLSSASVSGTDTDCLTPGAAAQPSMVARPAGFLSHKPKIGYKQLKSSFSRRVGFNLYQQLFPRPRVTSRHRQSPSRRVEGDGWNVIVLYQGKSRYMSPVLTSP